MSYITSSTLQKQSPTQVTIIYNQDFDVPQTNTEYNNEPEDPFSRSLSTVYNQDALQGDTARASVLLVAKQISTLLSDICGIKTTLYPVKKLDDIKQYLKHQANSTSLIFNLCESIDKDARFEAHIAELLHHSKIPYTGNRPRTLSLCLNKFRTTEKLKKHGMAVPTSHLVTRLKDIKNIISSVSFPCIIKPNREDGSTGIESSSVVYHEADLEQRVKKILKECNQAALIQEYIDGREISVSLLGHKYMKIIGIGEVDFSNLDPALPKIVTYASKWTPGTPEYLGTKSTAPNLTEQETNSIETTARSVAKAVFLTGYGRIDMRLTPEGIPYVVDVNPNCDLDPDAGLARTAERNGVSYRQLIVEIIEAGVAARVPTKHRHYFRELLSLLPHIGNEEPETAAVSSSLY